MECGPGREPRRASRGGSSGVETGTTRRPEAADVRQYGRTWISRRTQRRQRWRRGRSYRTGGRSNGSALSFDEEQPDGRFGPLANSAAIRPCDVAAFYARRRSDAGPATVNLDLTILRGVFRPPGRKGSSTRTNRLSRTAERSNSAAGRSSPRSRSDASCASCGRAGPLRSDPRPMTGVAAKAPRRSAGPTSTSSRTSLRVVESKSEERSVDRALPTLAGALWQHRRSFRAREQARVLPPPARGSKARTTDWFATSSGRAESHRDHRAEVRPFRPPAYGDHARRRGASRLAVMAGIGALSTTGSTSTLAIVFRQEPTFDGGSTRVTCHLMTSADPEIRTGSEADSFHHCPSGDKALLVVRKTRPQPADTG